MDESSFLSLHASAALARVCARESIGSSRGCILHRRHRLGFLPGKTVLLFPGRHEEAGQEGPKEGRRPQGVQEASESQDIADPEKTGHAKADAQDPQDRRNVEPELREL